MTAPAQRVPKIFGIGLMKTGTTSLAAALEILGFKAFHDVNLYERIARSTGEVFPREILETHDAFCDWPFPSFYKELDQRYPKSKFILTTRALDSWLRSFEAHVRRNRLNPRYSGNLRFFHRDAQVYLWQTHHKNVMDYFKRSENFLVMDMAKGEGWKKLCLFLGTTVPDRPFPHENQSDPDSFFKSKLRDKMNAAFARAFGSTFL